MPSLRHTLIYPLIVSLVALVIFNAALYGLLPPTQPVPALNPARSFHLDFDHGLVNTEGWHRVEFFRDGPNFQWTSASPASITFPLEYSGAMMVEFAVIQAINERMYSQLELFVNNRLIPLNREEKHYWGVIPADALNRDAASVTLVFRTPPPQRPIDTGMNTWDVRPLGIAFDWLDLRPETP